MFVAWSNRHCSNRHCLHALLDFLNYLVHSLEKVVPPIPDEWRANYQQGAWHPAEVWPRGGVRPVHAEPHLVSHRLLGGSWFLKSFPRCQDLMDHLSHGRCCECLTATQTPRSAPWVWTLDGCCGVWWSTSLTEVEAYMCQHLPDLYTAPGVCEESVGRAGEVSPFFFGRMCLGGQVWLKVILDLFSKSSFSFCFEALIFVIGPLEK